MGAVASNRRLVAIAILAGALLLALIIATGGGFQAPPSTAPGNPAPAATSASTPQLPSGTIQGVVSAQARHLTGHAWLFAYTVKNTGKYPIAGFQINGPLAKLYDVSGPSGWTVYGGGVCQGGSFGSMLVYWSVGPGKTNNLGPGKSGRFSYRANTSGTGHDVFSLSYGSYTPMFSSTTGPAASTLKPSAPCR